MFPIRQATECSCAFCSVKLFQLLHVHSLKYSKYSLVSSHSKYYSLVSSHSKYYSLVSSHSKYYSLVSSGDSFCRTCELGDFFVYSWTRERSIGYHLNSIFFSIINQKIVPHVQDRSEHYWIRSFRTLLDKIVQNTTGSILVNNSRSSIVEYNIYISKWINKFHFAKEGIETGTWVTKI